MTTLVNCDDNKLRAKHRSWEKHISNRPIFRNQVTIDQCDVEDAWADLSVNTSFIEFRELPVRMHQSLIKEIIRSLHKETKR